MSKYNPSDNEKKHYDWAKNAEDAAKKTEAKIEQLKEEARQELYNNKEKLQ